MPSECAANPLQRALADAIIRMVPMDELRILLACGAKVLSDKFKKKSNKYQKVQILGKRASHTRTLCITLCCLAEKCSRYKFTFGARC